MFKKDRNLSFSLGMNVRIYTENVVLYVQRGCLVLFSLSTFSSVLIHIKKKSSKIGLIQVPCS